MKNKLSEIFNSVVVALVTVLISPIAVAGTALEAEYGYSAWECEAINLVQHQFITRVREGIINEHSSPLFVVCPMTLDWSVVRNTQSNNGLVMFDISVGFFDDFTKPTPPSFFCFARINRIASPGSPAYNFLTFNAPFIFSGPVAQGFSGTGPFILPPIIHPDIGDDVLADAQLLCKVPRGLIFASYRMEIY